MKIKMTILEAGSIVDFCEFRFIRQVLKLICNFVIKYPHLWSSFSHIIELYHVSLKSVR